MSLRKKNRRLIVLLIIFSIGGLTINCVPKTSESPEQEHGIAISALVALTEDELSQQIPDALNGDPEAAYRIAKHFLIWVKDREKSLEWHEIAIENGELGVQYVFAKFLLNTRNNKEFNTRGVFWLYELAKIGHSDAEEQLGKIGYTLETSRPPDDSGFPFDYTRLSETELVPCEEGALRGNIKASLLLAKHYEEITGDNELAEYWYRIGAQNGSLECQYKLSQILSRKDDQLDQIRGKFWFDRVVKDGYNLNNGNNIL